jgi:hypothetical protein
VTYDLASIKKYFAATNVAQSDADVLSAHWAYFDHKKDARAFCITARSQDYTLALANKSSDGQKYVVVFCAKGLLTPTEFLSQVLEAQRLTEKFGGLYDGYEHSATQVGDRLCVIDYEPEPFWAVRY